MKILFKKKTKANNNKSKSKKNSNKFFLRKKIKNLNGNYYREIEKTRTKVTPQINRINIPNSSSVIVMTKTPNSFNYNTKRKLDLNNKNESPAKRTCYSNVTPVTNIINYFSNIKMHSPILSKSKFFFKY